MEETTFTFYSCYEQETHNDLRGNSEPKKTTYIFKMPSDFIYFSTLQATVRHRVFGEEVLRTAIHICWDFEKRNICFGRVNSNCIESIVTVRVNDMPNEDVQKVTRRRSV